MLDTGKRFPSARRANSLSYSYRRLQATNHELTGWVEDNIDETLTFYRLPRQHHKHLKSTNMLERLNEEIRRRTQVVRIFPNAKVACGWCGRSPSRPTRTGSSCIATSTWTICASTRRRHYGVRPDPDPFSLAPCSLCQGRCAPASPVPPRSRRHP